MYFGFPFIRITIPQRQAVTGHSYIDNPFRSVLLDLDLFKVCGTSNEQRCHISNVPSVFCTLKSYASFKKLQLILSDITVTQ